MRTTARLAVRSVIVSTVAAVVATVALVAPAQADGAQTPESGTVSAPVAGAAAGPLEQAVGELEPYVSRSEADGTFVLDAPRELLAEIEPEIHQSILDGMELINGLIRSGALVSTPDLRAVPAGSDASGGVSPTHHGVNSLDCGWVNCTLKLDRANTSNVIALLAIGAGAAALTSAICAMLAAGTCTPVAAAAAAILTIGGGVLELCANSHGVWVRYGLGSWCGGQ